MAEQEPFEDAQDGPKDKHPNIFNTEPHRDWLPIATAPRDGEEIITLVVMASVPIVRSASWDDGEDWKMQAAESIDDARGWWSSDSSVGSSKLEGNYEPTHWMRMPRPPGEDFCLTVGESLKSVLRVLSAVEAEVHHGKYSIARRAAIEEREETVAAREAELDRMFEFLKMQQRSLDSIARNMKS